MAGRPEAGSEPRIARDLDQHVNMLQAQIDRNENSEVPFEGERCLVGFREQLDGIDRACD